MFTASFVATLTRFGTISLIFKVQFSIARNMLFLHFRADVVRCLSESVRGDTLQDKDHKVSEPCRRQLRFELLQRVTYSVLEFHL